MMSARLEEYREVAPRGDVDLLLRLAARLRARRFLHVNAGRFGGGSPEILGRLIPLLGELSIDAAWEVIVGDPEFYAAVRAMELALAGQPQTISEAMLEVWAAVAARNAPKLPLDADLVMIHDLAPLLLVRHRPGGGRFTWHCHADLSRASRRAWLTVQRELDRYDAVVFSLPKFAQRVRRPMLLIQPSVDPLSEKNRELSRGEVQQALDGLGVPRDKPILLQVAPYTKSRDPRNVIRAYRLAKKYEDCRLVLAGAGETDGVEGGRAVLAEAREEAAQDPDLHVLVLPPDAAHEINALQRAATVVVHMPPQEDFGLAVTEAMWKGKPVIASPAGGIPVQVIPEVTGYIVRSVEGAAFRMRQLLQQPEVAARLGGAAREFVRRNFLLTRHLGEYLALLASLTSRSG
jgi:trehalose synthase